MIFHAPKQTWWMPSCPYQVALSECLMPDSTSDGIRVAVQSEYLAGEVPLSFERDESIRPHAEPTQAELEPLLKHLDKDLVEAAWQALSTYQRNIFKATTGSNPIDYEEAQRRNLPAFTQSIESLSRTAVTMEEREKAEEQRRQAKKEKKAAERDLGAEKKEAKRKEAADKKAHKDRSDKGAAATKKKSEEKEKDCQKMVIGILQETGDFFMSKPGMAAEIHKRLEKSNYNGGDIPAKTTIENNYIKMPSHQEQIELEKAAEEKARKEAEKRERVAEKEEEAARAREKAAEEKSRKEAETAKTKERVRKIVDLASDSFAKMSEEDRPRYVQQKLLLLHKKTLSLEEIKEHLTHL